MRWTAVRLAQSNDWIVARSARPPSSSTAHTFAAYSSRGTVSPRSSACTLISTLSPTSSAPRSRSRSTTSRSLRHPGAGDGALVGEVGRGLVAAVEGAHLRERQQPKRLAGVGKQVVGRLGRGRVAALVGVDPVVVGDDDGAVAGDLRVEARGS